MTRNITFAVDDEILQKVRVLAAHRRTSVNALVRDYLKSLVGKDSEMDEARAKLLRLAEERAGDMGTKSWKREDLYDR
jgi:plasmid stability protein